MKHVLIGVDPGFASIGLAVVELGPEGKDHVVALNLLRTEKSSAKKQVLATDDNVRRAREIVLEIKSVMDRPGCNIVGICAESMSFPRNSSAAAKMAMTWGILVALVGDKPIFQCSPQELKLRVAGSKQATKEDVKSALVSRFGPGLLDLVKAPPSQHEHVFDALGSVVACMQADQIRMVRNMLKS